MELSLVNDKILTVCSLYSFRSKVKSTSSVPYLYLCSKDSILTNKLILISVTINLKGFLSLFIFSKKLHSEQEC